MLKLILVSDAVNIIILLLNGFKYAYIDFVDELWGSRGLGNRIGIMLWNKLVVWAKSFQEDSHEASFWVWGGNHLGPDMD